MFRLTVLLLCLQIGNCLALGSYAQQKTFTFRLENRTLAEVLREIEKQSEYVFFYADRDIDLNRRVSIEVEGQTIDRLLEELFRKSDNVWQLNDRQVIIRKAGQKTASVHVKGVVKDEKGNPLPGVTVLIKGTTMGVVTDADGNYSIELPDAQDVRLIFSFIGMKAQEVAYTGQPKLNIVMQEDIAQMDEVVVNGLFTQNRNSYTGSVETVTADEIMSISQTNLLQALSVLIPGLRIVNNNAEGSNPNHVPEIIIRGMTSVSSTGETGINRPLIIIDNVEMTLEQLYDMDIFEIDRVDVLKDASATAIYGDKAANGVIVVTRKKVGDRKLRLSYNFIPKVSFPDISSFNLCNAAEKLELERLYGLYDSPTGEYDQLYWDRLRLINKGVFTDWAAIPLRNVWTFDNSVNMSGGGAKMDYQVNLRYGNNRGVMKGDHRENYSFGVYYNYMLNDRFSINFRSDWSRTDAKASPYGSFTSWVRMNPYDMPKDEQGRWNKELSYNMNNPLYESTVGNSSKNTSKTFTNSLNVRWEALDRLFVTGHIDLTWGDTKAESFKSPESTIYKDETDITKKGAYDISASESFNIAGNFNLNYSLPLNDEKSTILTLNVGSTISKSNTSSYAFGGLGFLKPSLNDISYALGFSEERPEGSESITTQVGWFSNLNFIFKNRYFLDVSYRISGASNYGVDERYSPYWSLGLGWNVHKERFFEGSRIVNSLRIRGSIGYVGSGNFGGVKPNTIYSYGVGNVYYDGMGAIPVSMGNPDLKSQRTLSSNFGINSTFLDERLDINVDFYRQETKDLLMEISVPSSAGISTAMSNIGESLNWGYEVNLSFMPVRTKDFWWRIGLTTTKTKNKIKKISSALAKQNEENQLAGGLTPLLQLEEGEAMDAIYAVRSMGINPANGKELFITKDGEYTFTYNPKDKVAFGSATPKFEGGITSSFGYKSLSVNIAGSFRLGGYQYNTTRAGKIENINPKYNVDRRALTLRWHQADDIVDYIRPESSQVIAQSERFVEKDNEFVLSSVNVMYNLTPKFLQKFRMKGLALGITFNDVLRFSKIKYERGTDYPYMRSFNFTIRPSF